MDNEKDPYILLRLPMTKAAVRGMDATTEIAASKSGLNITKFMIAGASKVFSNIFFSIYFYTIFIYFNIAWLDNLDNSKYRKL
jgi:PhoPQ-activated pathogenicity-related protein